MKSKILLLLFFLAFYACAAKEDSKPKEPAAKDLAVQEIALVSQEVVVEPKESVTTETHTVEAKVVPEETEPAKEQKEEKSASTLNADEIITDGRWGFSIYDPASGLVEYYTSGGGFLGKKQKEKI